MYNLRLKAKTDNNSALSTVTKLLMNSVSGKLGQRTFGNSIIIHDNDFNMMKPNE